MARGIRLACRGSGRFAHIACVWARAGVFCAGGPAERKIDAGKHEGLRSNEREELRKLRRAAPLQTRS
jgi:hypothetical protein